MYWYFCAHLTTSGRSSPIAWILLLGIAGALSVPTTNEHHVTGLAMLEKASCQGHIDAWMALVSFLSESHFPTMPSCSLRICQCRCYLSKPSRDPWLFDCLQHLEIYSEPGRSSASRTRAPRPAVHLLRCINRCQRFQGGREYDGQNISTQAEVQM
jgi:hypothetical protein